MIIRFLSAAILFLLVSVFVANNVAAQVQFSQPVVSDSRVKTFVYNPNDIYRIYTHYGYQSNIEFGEKERIRTISVGDRVSWQIIPSRNRLFIRPLEHGAQTNMTIITNERAYQFDLQSSEDRILKPTDELVYVARFYYPDEETESLSLPIVPSISSAASQPTVSAAPLVPLSLKPLPAATSNYQLSAPTNAAPLSSAATLNYNYSYVGPDSIAPRKIYDDGQSTYLKLPLLNKRMVTKVTRLGERASLKTYRNSEGSLVVPTVAKELVVHYDNKDRITIYNEAL